MNTTLNFGNGYKLYVVNFPDTHPDRETVHRLGKQGEMLQLAAMLENKVRHARLRVAEWEQDGVLEEFTPGGTYTHNMVAKNGKLVAMKVTDETTVSGIEGKVVIEFVPTLMTQRDYLDCGLLHDIFTKLTLFDEHIMNAKGVAAYFTDGLGQSRAQLRAMGYLQSEVKVSVPPMIVRKPEDWQRVMKANFYARVPGKDRLLIPKGSAWKLFHTYITEGYKTPVDGIRTPRIIPAERATKESIDAVPGKYIAFLPIRAA